MKHLPTQDQPLIPGGVKPGDTGDCLPDPFPFPDYPTFPTVPDTGENDSINV
jgi:hypothetical protein